MRRHTQHSLSTRRLVLGIASAFALVLSSFGQWSGATPVDDTWIEVQLVAAGDGAPIPGATVITKGFFYRGEVMIQDSLQSWEPVDSMRYTADADGKVRIEDVGRSLGIVAVAGEGTAASIGFEQLWGDDLGTGSVHTLKLRASKSLAIEVVDELGEAQPDVALGFGESSNRNSINGDPFWLTGPDGRLMLHGVNVLLPSNLLDSSSALFVQAETLGRGVAMDFDVESPPEDPLKLVVSPGAQVVVRPVDTEGNLLAEESLFLQFSATVPDQGFGGSVMRTRSIGTWTVGSVPPSADLYIVGFRGKESLRMEVNAVAPDKVGEKLTVDLVFGGPRWEFHGRLVDVEGDPVPNFQFNGSLGGTGFGPGRTDAEGRFVQRLGMGYARAGIDEHRLHIYKSGRRGTVEASAKTRPITEGENEDPIELGDIELVWE